MTCGFSRVGGCCHLFFWSKLVRVMSSDAKWEQSLKKCVWSPEWSIVELEFSLGQFWLVLSHRETRVGRVSNKVDPLAVVNLPRQTCCIDFSTVYLVGQQAREVAERLNLGEDIVSCSEKYHFISLFVGWLQYVYLRLQLRVKWRPSLYKSRIWRIACWYVMFCVSYLGVVCACLVSPR